MAKNRSEKRPKRNPDPYERDNNKEDPSKQREIEEDVERMGGSTQKGKDDFRSFTDGEPGDYTCYMCGTEHIEAIGGLTRWEGMALCSGACSKAYDECRYLQPEEREAFIQTYRANPEEKERRQKEVDEERRRNDEIRARGFGPRMR